MNAENIKHNSFVKKPISVPAEYRPSYKIAQLCLILKYTCIRNRSGLLKLHLLSWALKSFKNRHTLLQFIESDFNMEISVWGMDPVIERALQVAVVKGYCTYSKGKYGLADKGLKFTQRIEEDKLILSEEREFLMQIGKKQLTEQRLHALSNKWTLLND